ncbi:dynein regulatory complex subunit 4 [Lampris incognitus]|uniref:dynein regulatory complex subunit 4 n=1 Tax=Lampris incognitus TaxID=2546036 RepID=UPI0024B54322|nr:dynein regulatory complex subunit 4 [Lampris incognitus]
MQSSAMPPKTKGANKKSSKGKTPTVIDGLSTEEMSKEQLEELIVCLREELDREREERNYFQLERDEITNFLEITKRQREESNAELRNRDREMEEAEARHQAEIKVYKQKVKHLLFEHQNAISELKTEGVVSTNLMQNEHAELESELRKGVRALKVDIKEGKLSHENLIKSLKLKYEEELTETRKDFERQVREIESKYEKKMHMLRQEEERRRKTEIHAIEDGKKSHIATLIKNHEKSFSDMNSYYNSILQNNMTLIKTLKEQVEDMRKREERMVKEKAKVTLQSKSLTETLQKTKEEQAELQRKLSSYEKDKTLLASTKASLKVTKKDLTDLKWEHEVLVQRFSEVEKERNELYNKFTKAILEVQQKCGFKNLLLERKQEAMTETLVKKEAQLNAVLSASNMDKTSLDVVTGRLEEMLAAKNTAIKDLQLELARVCKAHNDLQRTYKAKLNAFGIPVEELGFTPLKSSLVDS